MDALEFLKINIRMCERGCDKCPADIRNNGYGVGCVSLKRANPEQYIKMVYKWGKEHQLKTRAEKIKELFPNVEERNGVPNLCPRVTEGKTATEFKCELRNCMGCIKHYWEGEYNDN